MNLDPELADILAKSGALQEKHEDFDIDEARRRDNDRAARIRGVLTEEIPEQVRLWWTGVPRAGGDEIPILIHRSVEQTANAPVLIWAHGGGFVSGSPLTTVSRTAALCKCAGVIVVSVDYRLLPEHHFPDNLDDIVTVVEWVMAGGLGSAADPNRIVVGGDSAGGNLAAATCIVARSKLMTGIVGQLLEVPVLDLSDTSNAMIEARRDIPFLAEALHESHERYLALGATRGDPRCEPLTIENTKGLPPALLVNCEVDPLRDDVYHYAARLASGGVPVETVLVKGMAHGTQGFTKRFPQAARAQRRMVTWLQEVTRVDNKNQCF